VKKTDKDCNDDGESDAVCRDDGIADERTVIFFYSLIRSSLVLLHCMWLSSTSNNSLHPLFQKKKGGGGGLPKKVNKTPIITAEEMNHKKKERGTGKQE
jgi:hypothetical protein